MRRVIHKAIIPLSDKFLLVMPQNAKVLHVQPQLDPRDVEPKVCIWYMFHPNDYQNTWRHEFTLATTGHEFNIDNDDHYVGTFLLFDGEFVGHLFHHGAKELVHDVPAAR